MNGIFFWRVLLERFRVNDWYMIRLDRILDRYLPIGLQRHEHHVSANRHRVVKTYRMLRRMSPERQIVQGASGSRQANSSGPANSTSNRWSFSGPPGIGLKLCASGFAWMPPFDQNANRGIGHPNEAGCLALLA